MIDLAVDDMARINTSAHTNMYIIQNAHLTIKIYKNERRDSDVSLYDGAVSLYSF